MPRLCDYGRMLLGKKCKCDGNPSLASLPIEYYDHEGGWKVEGFENRQWLSVVCPKCKYGWSLWKLDVPGKATFDEQLVEEIRRHGRVTTFTTTHTSQELEAKIRSRS